MRQWFDKHFLMNRKELQGLSFFTIFIILLWILPNLYGRLKPLKQDPDFALREKEVLDFLAKNKAYFQVDNQSASSLQNVGKDKLKPEYFTFDPNRLTVDEADRLGLSDYQIRMIQNFVSKGGRFYKQEDFAKIYSITTEDYQRLSPYIRIPDQSSKKDNYKKQTSRNFTRQANFDEPLFKQLSIELNTIDSIGLQELKGIGPVFASRIVRFRDLLGGFHDKAQLLNVYGMDKERFSQIQDHVYVDTIKIKKININTINYQELLKHPYISPKQANVIIQFRNQHGNYLQPSDLLKIELLNEDFLRKIAPYLAFTDD